MPVSTTALFQANGGRLPPISDIARVAGVVASSIRQERRVPMVTSRVQSSCHATSMDETRSVAVAAPK